MTNPASSRANAGAEPPEREQPIIVAEEVSKRYMRIEHRPSLRHEALSIFRRLFSQKTIAQVQPFNALERVSFSVYRGETIGIVGRNGSGKTTLLRLLSGIAQPTSGQVRVRGRFAALIGLGAAFIPELSGRKNIYLNAAIFGVPPRETAQIIDEIIDFAEIRAFIDSPIKHYSSGMAARLGFSIAVHTLPEIVFVDEVLAVGDAPFQDKCMARMLHMKAEGRTILFVSHAASAIQTLCERTLWLHNGRLMLDGETSTVLQAYAEMQGAAEPAPPEGS